MYSEVRELFFKYKLIACTSKVHEQYVFRCFRQEEFFFSLDLYGFYNKIDLLFHPKQIIFPALCSEGENISKTIDAYLIHNN